MSDTPFGRNHNVSRATPILPGTSSPAAGELPPVRIYQPARSVMSSRPSRKEWVLEFERSSAPFIEPLMGWIGGSDPPSQVRLDFPNLQAAIVFAERHGWRYRVEESPARRVPLKSYADRFKYELAAAIQRATSCPGSIMGAAARAHFDGMAGPDVRRGSVGSRHFSSGQAAAKGE